MSSYSEKLLIARQLTDESSTKGPRVCGSENFTSTSVVPG